MSFPKSLSIAAVSGLMLAGAVTVPADAATTAPAVASFSNCTELNAVYRHGISNRHFTPRQWIRRGASGKGAYKPRVYKRVHTNLDRDDDHIACEN